jgi:hypothetical protein
MDPNTQTKILGYINGPHIDGYPRLGATAIHIPYNTIICIDFSGMNETHTITRAELSDIRVALDAFQKNSLVVDP